MIPEEIIDGIVDWFDLKKYVSKHMEFHYVLHTQGSLKQKKVVLKPTNVILILRRLGKNGNECAVTLDYLILGFCYQSVDETKKDLS